MDVREAVDKLFVNPSKHLNLGWTLTSVLFTGAFVLGLFLVAICLTVIMTKPEYKNGSQSRTGILVLGWIGFSLMIFGTWFTVMSFYKVVQRINTNVKVKRECSLFLPETPLNAAEKFVSDATFSKDLDTYIANRTRETAINPGDVYTDPDARQALISREYRRSEIDRPRYEMPSADRRLLERRDSDKRDFSGADSERQSERETLRKLQDIFNKQSSSESRREESF